MLESYLLGFWISKKCLAYFWCISAAIAGIKGVQGGVGGLFDFAKNIADFSIDHRGEWVLSLSLHTFIYYKAIVANSIFGYFIRQYLQSLITLSCIQDKQL